MDQRTGIRILGLSAALVIALGVALVPYLLWILAALFLFGVGAAVVSALVPLVSSPVGSAIEALGRNRWWHRIRTSRWRYLLFALLWIVGFVLLLLVAQDTESLFGIGVHGES